MSLRLIISLDMSRQPRQYVIIRLDMRLRPYLDTDRIINDTWQRLLHDMSLRLCLDTDRIINETWQRLLHDMSLRLYLDTDRIINLHNES